MTESSKVELICGYSPQLNLIHIGRLKVARSLYPGERGLMTRTNYPLESPWNFHTHQSIYLFPSDTLVIEVNSTYDDRITILKLLEVVRCTCRHHQ